MNNAAGIFYDIASNHSNEVLSPQHEELYAAVIKNMKKKEKVVFEGDVIEPMNGISLKALSMNLSGLVSMSMSFRQDT